MGDYLMTGFSFVFYALPSFLLAFLLIIVFAFRPAGGSPRTQPQSNSLTRDLADGKALV